MSHHAADILLNNYGQPLKYFVMGSLCSHAAEESHRPTNASVAPQLHLFHKDVVTSVLLLPGLPFAASASEDRVSGLVPS